MATVDQMKQVLSANGVPPEQVGDISFWFELFVAAWESRHGSHPAIDPDVIAHSTVFQAASQAFGLGTIGVNFPELAAVVSEERRRVILRNHARYSIQLKKHFGVDLSLTDLAVLTELGDGVGF